MQEDPIGLNREVDPSIHSNYCIREASRNGNAGIVRLLLNDPRVNPSVSNNEALLNAVKIGNVETVRVLMEYGNLLF
jgi:hypothetical protein